MSAVHAIKSELPNTRKRLARATYRNYLKTKNRTDMQAKAFTTDAKD
jgi:hypothetical protein